MASPILDKLQALGVDVADAMPRMLDDEDFYLECLHMLLVDEGFGALGQALKAADYKEAFNQAHALKGVTGNLGLTPLYAPISRLVETLRAQKSDGVDKMYDDIMTQLEILKETLA